MMYAPCLVRKGLPVMPFADCTLQLPHLRCDARTFSIGIGVQFRQVSHRLDALAKIVQIRLIQHWKLRPRPSKMRDKFSGDPGCVC